MMAPYSASLSSAVAKTTTTATTTTTTTDDMDRILNAQYLEKAKTKKDLLRRLRKLWVVLRDDDEEMEEPEDHPGLAGLAQRLVSPSSSSSSSSMYLDHRDKEIRLHAVLCCVELFCVYAPDPPWEADETLQIFEQLIRQLGNMVHTTTPEQTNYHDYLHLLDRLAEVKIGIVLVELSKEAEAEQAANNNDHDNNSSYGDHNDHHHDDDDDDDGEARKENNALEVLVSLVHTLLHLHHNDHEAQVQSLCVRAIAACLEEYEGRYIPLALLEELLVCIGAGATIQVTNPAFVEATARNAQQQQRGRNSKTKKKKKTTTTTTQPEVVEEELIVLPPKEIAQVNSSYMVGSAVIRKCVDHLSNGLATFLNGLLNGDNHITQQTSISTSDHPANDKSSIWNIIYELHKIAPSVLTTVIGTVTHSLKDPTKSKRIRVVKLLGRLFHGSDHMAKQYAPCFREWLQRSNDAEQEVRLVMVHYLGRILAQGKMVDEVTAVLIPLLDDPTHDVRRTLIRTVCDLAYKHQEHVPPDLLRALGGRVAAKHKVERKDALIGLARIYFKFDMYPRLDHVQQGGDDVDIAIILEALLLQRDHHHQDSDIHTAEETYGWIPTKVVLGACWTDQHDPEMRTMVIRVVDEVLLGNPAKSGLTPTARTVGLAWILKCWREDGVMESFENLLQSRVALQQAVSDFLDARHTMRAAPKGTEVALAAAAVAKSQLEQVIQRTAPPAPSLDVDDLVNKISGARDNHIFRLLATVCDPTHSTKARARALDELPKRTKSLGDNVSAWMGTLAQRCAMGHFMTAELIHHAILLAQECFTMEGNLEATMDFLQCVKIASDYFPRICCEDEHDFETLMELFTSFRAVKSKSKQKEMEKSGLLTVLSSILAKVAPIMRRKQKNKKNDDDDHDGLDDDQQRQLLRLCTRDGTPQQAKNAVSTMAALLGDGANDKDVEQTYVSLLNSLTTPSHLTLTEKGTTTTKNDSKTIVTVLAALTALSEKVPRLFSTSSRGKRAMQFALETVLLGKKENDSDVEDENDDEEDDSDDDEEVELKTPSKRRSSSFPKRGRTPRSSTKKSPSTRRGVGRKNLTPGGKMDVLEDEMLSIACRRICAAIELLVTHLTSSIKTKVSPPSPTPSHITQVFGILSQILQDHGVPPSSRDRRKCKLRQDRAALRQCSAVQLFRLCNAGFGLHEKYLTESMWHTLSHSLLDEEHSVRESVMEELSHMLKGTGHYPGTAPALRFVSMVVFCVDPDERKIGYAGANANAANVGKASQGIKEAAMVSIRGLRRASETTLNECRRLGASAERKFEAILKMRLMPEYALPFAIHLLSFRRETPSAGGYVPGVPGLSQVVPTQPDGDDDKDDDYVAKDDEPNHKMLRKRLKWLLEPMVESLGDSADNISFLLRMTELIGGYQPVNVFQLASDADESFASLGISPMKPSSPELRNVALSVAKLKTTCLAARQVLLSFVKKDVNLALYPGNVLVPKHLFEKLKAKFAKGNAGGHVEDKKPAAHTSKERPKKRQSVEDRKSGRVHFSPELVIRRPKIEEPSPSEEEEEEEGYGEEQGAVDFADLSPIKADSPAISETRSRKSTTPGNSVKTLGTTPPSNIKTQKTTPPSNLKSPTYHKESEEEEDFMLHPPPAANNKESDEFESPRARRAAARRSRTSTQDSTPSAFTEEPIEDDRKPMSKRKAKSQNSGQTTKRSKQMKEEEDDSEEEVALHNSVRLSVESKESLSSVSMQDLSPQRAGRKRRTRHQEDAKSTANDTKGNPVEEDAPAASFTQTSSRARTSTNNAGVISRKSVGKSREEAEEDNDSNVKEEMSEDDTDGNESSKAPTSLKGRSRPSQVSNNIGKDDRKKTDTRLRRRTGNRNYKEQEEVVDEPETTDDDMMNDKTEHSEDDHEKQRKGRGRQPIKMTKTEVDHDSDVEQDDDFDLDFDADVENDDSDVRKGRQKKKASKSRLSNRGTTKKKKSTNGTKGKVVVSMGNRFSQSSTEGSLIASQERRKKKAISLSQTSNERLSHRNGKSRQGGGKRSNKDEADSDLELDDEFGFDGGMSPKKEKTRVMATNGKRKKRTDVENESKGSTRAGANGKRRKGSRRLIA